jgi:hypothetical protein
LQRIIGHKKERRRLGCIAATSKALQKVIKICAALTIFRAITMKTSTGTLKNYYLIFQPDTLLHSING